MTHGRSHHHHSAEARWYPVVTRTPLQRPCPCRSPSLDLPRLPGRKRAPGPRGRPSPTTAL